MKRFNIGIYHSGLNHYGFTLVELMVTLVITIAIGGIAGAILLAQHKSVMNNASIFDVRSPSYAATELLKRDFSQAGYGVLDLSDIAHPKNLAFFIQDGGNSNPDKIYLFDGSYINYTELEKDIFAEIGYAFFGGNGTTITLDHLNLDQGKIDNCYSGGNCDEFQGGVFQYIITNSTNVAQKVARITTITGNTLTLSNGVSGGPTKSLVSPAIYYCVDSDGTDTLCHPAGAETRILRRSSRSSGGRQPVVKGIVDMQVAYKDNTNTWYCDGTGTCPMSPFIPGNITLIRITLISERDRQTQGGTSTAQAENGRTWNASDKIYTPYTVAIRPRNNIEFN
jgi:hypothetical protein